MRRHPKLLENAGISPNRLGELQRICRQYPEYRRALALARAGVEDRRGASGVWRPPDPTGSAAARLADHPAARRVKLIVECAARVGGRCLARSLLRYVTEGQGYDLQHPRPPVGRRQFYQLALSFYVELDRRLWGE